ncbi:hypothetical protein Rumeso_01993 [Rubellimicrobium mesophilum DSM 19309]|uniref:Uncharacterized protein n=1 Tax=Rubellimicrobium mesophilum DSM 19309 TaxID=442562 RepID=A0A017HQ40_9RHOB|nr:hypothetical protein Rumeso_01993 [Rubellimicrobium mesophilum DSM 19309]
MALIDCIRGRVLSFRQVAAAAACRRRFRWPGRDRARP